MVLRDISFISSLSQNPPHYSKVTELKGFDITLPSPTPHISVILTRSASPGGNKTSTIGRLMTPVKRDQSPLDACESVTLPSDRGLW